MWLGLAAPAVHALQGIDLFDSAHLVNLVAGGYALSFPVTPEEEAAQAAADPLPAAARAAAGPAGEAAAAAAEGAAEDAAGRGHGAADRGEDDSKINLWALAHRTDARPLLPGCGCFACANHTRAYVHHLLQTHEMTAQVRTLACGLAAPGGMVRRRLCVTGTPVVLRRRSGPLAGTSLAFHGGNLPGMAPCRPTCF